MHRFSAVLATMLVLALAGAAWAEEAEGDVSVSTDDVVGSAPSTYVVGAYFGMGMVGLAGTGYVDAYNSLYGMGLEEDDQKVKFSAGGGAYFDLYLKDFLAVEFGIGFIGKGARAEGQDGSGANRIDWEIREKIAYMEIPLGAKFNIYNFQATVALGLWIALTGETKSKTEQGSTTATQTEEWEDDEWDRVRRFNLGPRITLGYAIELGPIFLVPSVTWMMHLINDLDEDAINDDIPGTANDGEFSARAWNLMFNVGVEYGF